MSGPTDWAAWLERVATPFLADERQEMTERLVSEAGAFDVEGLIAAARQALGVEP